MSILGEPKFMGKEQLLEYCESLQSELTTKDQERKEALERVENAEALIDRFTGWGNILCLENRLHAVLDALTLETKDKG